MTTGRHQPQRPGTMPAWSRVVIVAAIVLTGLLVLLIVAGTFFPGAAPEGIGAYVPHPAADASVSH